MELWKKVDEYPDYYVSNLGNVQKLLKTRHPLNIRPRVHSQGYLRVNLSKGKKKKDFYIHRLVADLFVENPDPDNLIQVNHLNEVKTDNRSENLEWCTHKYNSNYGTKCMRLSAHRSKPVVQMDLDGNDIRVFPRAEDARANGFKKEYIGTYPKDPRRTKCLWRYL